MVAPLTNWWVAQGLTWPGHFRYSTLVMIMPFMEQNTGFNALNFLIPLYDLNGDDMPQNTTVYSMQIKAFLCPSDVRDGIEIEFEMPCNYAACSGNGLPGGFSLPASYGNAQRAVLFQLGDDDGQHPRRLEQHGGLRREHHRHELEHPPVAGRAEPAGDRGPTALGHQHVRRYLHVHPPGLDRLPRLDELSLGPPDELDRRRLPAHALRPLHDAEQHVL